VRFFLNAPHLSKLNIRISSRIVPLPASSPENPRPWAASWPWAAAAVSEQYSPAFHQSLTSAFGLWPIVSNLGPGTRGLRPTVSHRIAAFGRLFFCLWPSVSGSKQDVVNLFAECSISAFGRLVRDVPSRPVGVSFGRLFLPRKIGLWPLGANHSFQEW
jgi:hypothetical protein